MLEPRISPLNIPLSLNVIRTKGEVEIGAKHLWAAGPLTAV
jgi:hypothetical protein